MWGPVIAGIVFSLLVIVLSFAKPNAGRIFLGIFFIAMGIGVNLAFLLNDPNYIVTYGRGAWLPLYRTLTESILSFNPTAFVILLIVFEVAMGVLLLTRGTAVKIGLAGTLAFFLFLVPLYYSQIAWAVAGVGNVYLLTRDFDAGLIKMIRSRKKRT